MSTYTEKLIPNLIDAYQVTAANTIRKGMTCVVTDGKVLETVGTDAIGIALDAGDASDPAKNRVRIHRFGAGIVPVLCSGTLAAGATVQPATDGAAAITVGGSTTLALLLGRLVDAGAAGNLAGCDVGLSGLTMA